MEREKSLEMAVTQIERQFGKGAIMKLGEDSMQRVAAISTGALSLDLALGIGGVPRGRIVEIYGPESSGKCLTADAYIWTDHGLETVAELFARCDQPTSCTSRVTDVSDRDQRVVNERGELEKVAALTHNNRRPVLRIKLRSGRSVKVTENHPLRVLNERGSIVWKPAGEIRSGDTVVSALFGAEEASLGEGLSEDEAVLLGYLVAEGSLSATNSVRFTNQDPELGDEFAALMKRLFEVEKVRVYNDQEHVVYSKTIRQELADRYGLDCVTAAGKKVPHCVRTAGVKAQKAFLSALFEGDGWIDPSSTIGFASASEQLAQEVQLLLYGFGIPATLSASWNPTYERNYWIVTINPSVSARFLERIGFRSQRRARQVERNFRPSPRDPQFENVPNSELRYTYEEVVEVEPAGVEPTFDLAVPRTHSFVANGILSHNTTVGLHIIAEAQRNGGIAAFIDAEHALDPVYARALGVNIDELLISQPDTGEQALEITDMLIRSGALDVVVIDSVAALVPRAEIEGEMGDSHVGLQARLMSQALRKLAGTINRSRTTAIFINQLREKIGIMFGCLLWDTRVKLADGSEMPIGKIVNQKLPVEVLSYDPELGEVVPRRVVNWFDNGITEEFLRIRVPNPLGRGRPPSVTCTPNHQIRTPSGWKEAQELAVGGRVLKPVRHFLSEFQWEVVLGGLMGDSALSRNTTQLSARLRWGHGSKQVEYGDWKASLFSNIGVSRSTNQKGAAFWDAQPLPELAELREAVYVEGKKVLNWDYLKRLTPLSLAIWYMDDGNFTLRSKGLQKRTRGGSGRSEICVEALEETSRQRLVEHLEHTWGIRGKLISRAGNAVLQFPTAETAKLHALLAPFVHPSMDYKLLSKYRGKFNVEPVFAPPRYELMGVPIVEISRFIPTQRRHRYDIEVEGSHNYFAEGVMVHNSPETTPGGRALKFYSSVRIDIRRIESIKDGTDSIGNRVRAKIAKNKVAPPFRLAEFDIMFGSGISREGSLLDVAVDQDIVRKSGAWYTFDDDQLGQGRENAKEFLRENPEIALQLQAKVLSAVGLSDAEAPVEEEAELADEKS